LKEFEILRKKKSGILGKCKEFEGTFKNLKEPEGTFVNFKES
jgi:hypothetical protein